MLHARFDATPAPHTQTRLFGALEGERVRVWDVVTGDGHTHTRTTTLGVAVTIARHLARDGGDVWVIAKDGSTAHVTPTGVYSPTPDLAWIATLTNSLTTTKDHI